MFLRRARIVGNDEPPRLIEIRDGRITAVRPDWDGLPVDGEVVDLDGRWIMPGLWDHHVHFSQWSIARDRVDVSPARSATHAASLIGAAVAARRGGDMVVGVGFRDALWPDVPSVQVLDPHTGNVPVVLISVDLHAVWLNSAALRRFGRDRASSGLVREDDAFGIQLAVADLPDARIDQLAADAAQDAAARGVVGIVDFEMPDIGSTWQRRIAAGLRSLRVVCSVWPSGLDAATARGLRTGDPLPGTRGLAIMGPLKVIIDGSLNTRTAYCFDPYPGAAGSHPAGLLTVTPDELAELLKTAQGAGIGAAVHAIGDRANAIALDAFEQVGGKWTGPASIEHAQLMAERDIARAARLGLVASVQPQHAADDRDVADRYWAGRTERAYAYGSLLAAGVPLAFGSDAPVAPLDPWIAIAAAVRRSSDDRPPWHPEQRVSVGDALRASVRTMIEPGAAADLAVLDRDPLNCPGEQLPALEVAATLLAGAWTFDRGIR